MKKRFMDNIFSIAGVLALITLIGWQIGEAGETKKNTSHRLITEYTQTLEWIAMEEKRCGIDAKDCGLKRQGIMRLYKIKRGLYERQLGLTN